MMSLVVKSKVPKRDDYIIAVFNVISPFWMSRIDEPVIPH